MFNKKSKKSISHKDASTSPKTWTNKVSDDILKTYGLEDEINAEFVEASHAPEAEPSKPTETAKPAALTPMASHADHIGWNKPKVWLTNFIYGLFMGFSDSVPGYSGGTTLSILGFYEKLIHNIKLIFKPDVKKYFWKYLLWFLPFLIAWIGILVAFMKLVDVAAAANMGVVFVFLFGGFAFCSIPLFYVSNKHRMINFKDFVIATKQKQKWTIVHWLMLFLGFAIMIAIGVTARLVPTTMYNGITIQGVTFVTTVENWTNNDFEPMQILFLLFSGFFAGFCVLIPGISGGLVLFATGWYPKIAQAISNMFVQVDFLPWLVVLAIGIVIGLITAVFTINIFLKRWEKIFYSLSFGLVLGSFIAIFTALSSYEYGHLANGGTLGLSIAMLIIAAAFNAGIFIFMNQTGRINYPKLRFNKTKATNPVA